MSDLVLSLDPAMRNMGYRVHKIDETKQSLGDKVYGGTFSTSNTEIDMVRRCSMIASNALWLIDRFDPKYVVLEGPIEFGQSRSISGTVLFSLIKAPLSNVLFRSLLKTPLNLKTVIVIHPRRLDSLLTEDGNKNTPALNRVRYEKFCGEKPACSEHEIDAYFLAFFGIRFIKIILEKSWDMVLLTPRERECYLESLTKKKGEWEINSMLAQEHAAWWNFPG